MLTYHCSNNQGIIYTNGWLVRTLSHSQLAMPPPRPARGFRLTDAQLLRCPPCPYPQNDDDERQGPHYADDRQPQVVHPVQLVRRREVGPGSPGPGGELAGLHHRVPLTSPGQTEVDGYKSIEDRRAGALFESRFRAWRAIRSRLACFVVEFAPSGYSIVGPARKNERGWSSVARRRG